MTNGHWQELDDGSFFWWPRCVVPGCTNSICLAKGETRFCWPHSSSGKTVDEIIAEHAALNPEASRT